MPGLILEGGTLRPIFSAGAMDCLLDHDIMFPYCIGVSAGISNGVSYISRQKGRNLDILKLYRHDKRYIGKRNLLTSRSLFGVDFVFGTIPNELIPFDREAFLRHEGTVLAGVTNALTGKAEYLDCKEIDEENTILRATCAIPGAFPAVHWKGSTYYDGGIADSIPIRKAMADGQEKNLIILTQPADFRKAYAKEYNFAIRLIGKKHPLMVDLLRNRHHLYNETLVHCERLEEDGKAVILRPDYPLNSLEKDIGQIERNYRHGYELCSANLARIRALFE
ncbi:MAG: patatin family protein [Clostridiaceae bacterium]|jgi:predicted patatin/cPLA2 family phospholipase|nr:patatin family protein [Oscillospiraceae bacterium]NLO62533.1 patatin family protein [Clostridiaceae bacterium]